ncbi:DUF6252 family protein [Flavobacterium subsaxonicum]|uniref:Uncharacterized protein n=1 Tax=Flavobacterium subsaxonicum WB 4.1-42 = DSM 21790 TaxID=1121898 RepID=A0A0A2MK77_9FLAO|nr:DUF6252 family protein [Flavobacterium subsaxonicum]KGO91903.1 hypothetical protein Q766_15800 [Flavobacterium subsaxonicum WB 4.1-42 = DSM 21790]
MKKITLTTFLVVFLSVFTACDIEPIDPVVNDYVPEDSGSGEEEGEEEGEENGGAVAGEFKVNFNNQTFVGSTVQAVYNDQYLAITAIKPDGSAFQITVPNATAGNTYTWPQTESVDFNDLIVLAYVPAQGGNAYVGMSDDYGEFADLPYVDTAEIKIVEINTVNHTVTGTFKFTGARFTNPEDSESVAIDTIEFTNGSFTSIPYTADVVGPTNNSFFAKLDGADFIPTNITGYVAMDRISLVGRRGPVENIGITVPSNITNGTYEISMFGNYVGIYILDSSTTGTFGANSGTLTITEHDTANNRIKGTFSFTATMFTSNDTHQITAGTFDVGY